MKNQDQSARNFVYYFRQHPTHARLFAFADFGATSFASLREALATEPRFTVRMPVLMDTTLAERLPIGAELFAIVEHWKTLLESHPCAIVSATGKQYEVARRLQVFARRLMVFAQPDQVRMWLHEIQPRAHGQRAVSASSTA